VLVFKPFYSFSPKVWILQYKEFDTNPCMSKYKDLVLALLSKTEIKSTNQILGELQNKEDKIINWHALYRILMELQLESKIERLESKAGFFWKKK